MKLKKEIDGSVYTFANEEVYKDYLSQRKHLKKLLMKRSNYKVALKKEKELEGYLTRRPNTIEFEIKEVEKIDEFALRALQLTRMNSKKEMNSTAIRYFYYEVEKQWFTFNYKIIHYIEQNTIDFLVLKLLFGIKFKNYSYKDVNEYYGVFLEMVYKFYCYSMDYYSLYDLNENQILRMMKNSVEMAWDLSQKDIKEIGRLNQIMKEQKKELMTHKNQKGKEWREDLMEPAKLEYQKNTILDKTKALRTAFENMPDKELHRSDFDLMFDSILRKFYKYLNSSM